jgi:hypothetical protein
LRPLNERIIASLKPAVRHVVGRYNLAYMACIVNATKFPNVHIVRNFVHGFPVYGQLYTAGCYGTGGKPPEQPVHEVLSPALNAHWNAHLLLSVQKRGDEVMRDITSDAYVALHDVWDTTCKELEAGWCIGVPLSVGQGVEPNQKWVGFTFEQVQDHPWVEHAAQLRLIRRFAVFQKEAYRCIDDCTENGFNPITGSSDKLSFIRADTPVHVARAFARERVSWEEKLVRALGLGCAGDMSFGGRGGHVVVRTSRLLSFWP